jgi:hypothetical protein
VENTLSSDVEKLVDQYIAVWNERDAAARRNLIDSVFTEDCGHTDPNDAVKGRAAIAQLVETLQARFPDFTFMRLGPVNAHHQQALFGWRVGAPETKAAATGTDFAIIVDGRIHQLHSFIDAPST